MFKIISVCAVLGAASASRAGFPNPLDLLGSNGGAHNLLSNLKGNAANVPALQLPSAKSSYGNHELVRPGLPKYHRPASQGHKLEYPTEPQYQSYSPSYSASSSYQHQPAPTYSAPAPSYPPVSPPAHSPPEHVGEPNIRVRIRQKDVFDSHRARMIEIGEEDSPYEWRNGTVEEAEVLFNDTAVVQKYGYIEFDSHPYTAFVAAGPDGQSDNLKFAFQNKIPYDVSEGEVLRFTAKLSNQNLGLERHPFDAALVFDYYDDPRLSSCGAYLYDDESGSEAQIVLTNRAVYFGMSRLASSEDLTAEFGEYRQFYTLRKLAYRKNPYQIHEVSLEYNRAIGSISATVDGGEPYVQQAIGIPAMGDKESRFVIDLGGNDQQVKPEQFRAGIFCQTILNGLDINQPKSNFGLVELVPAEEEAAAARQDDAAAAEEEGAEEDESRPSKFEFAGEDVTEEVQLFGNGAKVQLYKIEAVVESKAYGYGH